MSYVLTLGEMLIQGNHYFRSGFGIDIPMAGDYRWNSGRPEGMGQTICIEQTEVLACGTGRQDDQLRVLEELRAKIFSTQRTDFVVIKTRSRAIQFAMSHIVKEFARSHASAPVGPF